MRVTATGFFMFFIGTGLRFSDDWVGSFLKETEKGEAIINLASNEYNKAILWKKVKNPVITPVFKEFKNGEYKVVMIFAKHARGAMARYIIQNELTNLEDLKSYNVDGYSFDEKQSSLSEWVFVR